MISRESWIELDAYARWCDAALSVDWDHRAGACRLVHGVDVVHDWTASVSALMAAADAFRRGVQVERGRQLRAAAAGAKT